MSLGSLAPLDYDAWSRRPRGAFAGRWSPTSKRQAPLSAMQAHPPASASVMRVPAQCACACPPLHAPVPLARQCAPAMRRAALGERVRACLAHGEGARTDPFSESLSTQACASAASREVNDFLSTKFRLRSSRALRVDVSTSGGCMRSRIWKDMDIEVDFIPEGCANGAYKPEQ
jgi:hypothetical protein